MCSNEVQINKHVGIGPSEFLKYFKGLPHFVCPIECVNEFAILVLQVPNMKHICILVGRCKYFEQFNDKCHMFTFYCARGRYS